MGEELIVLDKNGVETVWNAMKNRIPDNANFTIDETLQKEDEKYGVKVPVRPKIYTEKEFEALSKEERNRGLYFVNNLETDIGSEEISKFDLISHQNILDNSYFFFFIYK